MLQNLILKLKDRLVSTLGWFGSAIFYAIYITFIIFVSFPGILFLNFPFWARILFFAAIFFIPYAGFNILAQFVIWIISFPVVLKSPFDYLSLYYYICFSIFIITTVVIPIVKAIIDTFSSKNRL